MAAHEPRLDDDADVVHQAGAQQRPDEMTGGIEADHPHAEVRGQPLEGRRQVHVFVAGDDRPLAVGGEGLEMRRRRGRRAERDHVTPVRLVAQRTDPRQAPAGVDRREQGTSGEAACPAP